jgi:hypothetical protein
MTSRQTITIALLCIAFLTSGCLRDFARSVAESRAVQQELTSKYGEEVEVSTSNVRGGTSVLIVFTDSKLNEQTREVRAKRALESVQIAKKKFSAETAPNEFAVQFHRIDPDAGVFAPPQFIDIFEFDRELRAMKRMPPGVVGPSGIGPPPEARYPTVIDQPTTRAVFLQHSGESDVAATPITLDGEPGQGLSLIPHFTVTGNANEQKASPPKEVSLDFAAYYADEKFTEEVEFKFIVDGASALNTKGRFTHSTASGLVTQFCYLKIPYSAFARLTNGETLSIKIGRELYELTEEEFETIKKMNSFVK